MCCDSRIVLGLTSLSSKNNQVSKNSPVPSGNSVVSNISSDLSSPPVIAQLKISKKAEKIWINNVLVNKLKN